MTFIHWIVSLLIYFYSHICVSLQIRVLKKSWRLSRARLLWRRSSGRACCCHASWRDPLCQWFAGRLTTGRLTRGKLISTLSLPKPMRKNTYKSCWHREWSNSWLDARNVYRYEIRAKASMGLQTFSSSDPHWQQSPFLGVVWHTKANS